MDLMVCFYCQRRKVALTTKRFDVIIMSVYIHKRKSKNWNILYTKWKKKKTR